MTIQVPAQALADAQGADTELWPLLLAVAYYESSWNPGAIGDGGCSKGYLQFNQCGGLGVGHSDAELLDGASNMRLGAQYIRARLASGASLWDALQPWSTRTQAYGFYQQMIRDGIEGTGRVPTTPASSSAGMLVGLAFIVGVWLVLGG